ncbi:MAG: hypothetical protein ACLPPF_19935 [Rhodomicrobium sp.]
MTRYCNVQNCTHFHVMLLVEAAILIVIFGAATFAKLLPLITY